MNTPLVLTCIGLVIATLTAVFSALISKESRPTKAALVALAVTGGAIAGWAAQSADSHAADDKVALETQLKATRGALDAANLKLEAQARAIGAVDDVVGQLAKLDDLGGGGKYYVRIAAGATEAELAKYEPGLLALFPGAADKKLIAVRPLGKGFELVMGNGLTLASAEAFKRLADRYAAGQSAQIELERH